MARITTPEQARVFIQQQIEDVRAQVGEKKVLLALSGGVDSSVVAALLIKAMLPEVPMRVEAKLCAGVTPASHEAALATMRSCQVAVL